MPHAQVSPSLRLTTVLLLGGATATFQTVAVREAMAAVGGNEAILAVLFGAWLVLTALGAHLGRGRTSSSSPPLISGFLAYAVVAPATLLAARLAILLLPTGVEPSLLVGTGVSALLLGPACVLSGWLYARIARPAASPSSEPDIAARAYWLDALGSAAAGIVLALILLDRLLPFAIVGLSSAIALAAAAILSARRHRIAFGALAIAAIPGFALLPIDRLTLPWQTPGQRVTSAVVTSRGTLLVTERQEQTQILLHRSALITVSQSAEGDQLAQVSAVLHPNPRSVLIVGIAPTLLVRTMREHGSLQIDQVVGDERIAGTLRAIVPDATEPGASLTGADERAFVRSCSPSSYDLAVVHAGSPTSVGMARLYSREFYLDLQRALKPDGVLVVTMPGHASYANVEQRRMHSTVASTLRSVFPAVLALPADLTLYAAGARLAAPEMVASTMQARLRERGVSPVFATVPWAAEVLSPTRLADAARWSSLPLAPSTDAHPVAYRVALDSALAQFDEGGLEILGALSLLLILLTLAWFHPRARPVPFSIATTGFAGLALQLVLMLVHQTAIGALYRDVALVSAAFMGATCLGTWWSGRTMFSRLRFIASDSSQALVAVAVAVAMPWLVSQHGIESRIAIVVSAAVVGAATGAQIAFAARAPAAFPAGLAGGVYAVDLLGASVAALATYTLVVPAIGLAGTALAVAGVKIASSLALWFPDPRGSPAHADRVTPLPVVVLVVLVVLASTHAAGRALYTWTSATAFSLCALVALAVHLLAPFEPKRWRDAKLSAERRLRSVSRALGISPLRVASFLLLLPVAVLPIARCYFRVPYVFCHACPRPCTFGILRPYAVTAALLANLGDRRFCERLCPLGQVQQAAERGRGRAAFRLGLVATILRLCALAAVVVLYFGVWGESRATAGDEGVFAWAFTNGYAVSATVLVVAGLLIALSFLVRRPFCEAACPIGAVSDVLGRAERAWVNSKTRLER